MSPPPGPLRAPSLVAAALCAALCVAPAPAGAVEREWQLGLEPAYAMAYAQSDPAGAAARAASGGGGLLRLAYSPRDSLSLQLLGGAAAHPGDGAAPTLLSFSAMAGVVYVFDVVRVVPFFELDVGLLGLRPTGTDGSDGGAPDAASGATRLGLGLGVGFGADYMVSRRLSVGVAARWAAALTDLQAFPLYLTVGPRLNLRFGE